MVLAQCRGYKSKDQESRAGYSAACLTFRGEMWPTEGREAGGKKIRWWVKWYYWHFWQCSGSRKRTGHVTSAIGVSWARSSSSSTSTPMTRSWTSSAGTDSLSFACGSLWCFPKHAERRGFVLQILVTNSGEISSAPEWKIMAAEGWLV